MTLEMTNEDLEIIWMHQIVLLMEIPVLAGHPAQKPIEIADPAETMGLHHNGEPEFAKNGSQIASQAGSGESTDIRTLKSR